MISVIICTINESHKLRIFQNIQDTIGVPFEFLAIDNRHEPRGICAVYNEGARKAKFECVCFVHEDVQFNTQGWGKSLVYAFKDQTWGLLGLAGAAHKPKLPSGWGAEGLQDRFIKVNLVQHFKGNRPPSLQYQNTEKEKIAEVACVDGVFLATTKSIIQEIPFDESLLTGFHGYDLDLSLAIGQHYKVGVTYEILAEHFSEGSLNIDWLKSSLQVHEKWADSLPKSVAPISKKEKTICEKRTYRFLLPILKRNDALEYSLKILHQGELMRLNIWTYLKMYISLGKTYFAKETI
ncbi:glycosyltransferase [Lunatibacter salilacus]|uniref:glycosyltransferase n=1 Tax=Lunatibacter salilacus TaxID=2483804 RepID=UPI00131B8CBC|nr:glycosyltransferase [Lunatibacter salilacus]